MADYALIDGYIDTLRARMPWRGDVEDLVAEVRDHLYSAVEGLEARGADAGRAQRETLQRFGDPELMASAFATTPQGGLAVPTRSTRRAGTLALIAAVLWLTTLAVWWLAGVAEPWGRVTYDALGTASGIWYTIGAAALLGASALTFVVQLGLDRRLGGLGAVGQVGLVFSGLSVVGALAAWVFMGWGLMLTIGTLLVASATLRRDIAPRPPMVAIGGSLAIGGIAWAVLRSVEGTLLRWGGLWGDSWTSNLVGITVGATLLAVGLFGLGGWLRGEVPVDAAGPDQAVAA